MSRRTTEQITQMLHSLLPAFTAASFPRLLVDLAGSLLIQSQSRAARLKSEEEPARCFTVCEIACHRLKTRLNLPKIESRPPCPPRTYKKLYQFLDRTLEAPKEEQTAGGSDAPYGVGRVTTPLKARPKSAASTPASASRTGKSVLPLLMSDGNGLEEPGTPTPSKKRKADEAPDEVRETAMPDVLEITSDQTPRSGKRLTTLRDDDIRGVIAEDDEPAMSDNDDSATAEPISKGCLGSLMENHWDNLSPEKRADYKRWEARMLRRIEAIERSQASLHAKR